MRRGMVFAVVAVAFALSGTAGADTKILAVGDFGVGGTAERTTGNVMRTWEAGHPANLLVTLGDNDYTENPTAFRRNWADAFGWLRSAGVWVRGTLGNHDILVSGGTYELNTLRMPAKYYERSRPGLDLFVLNSNSVGDRQTRWLHRHLAASTAPWKIVALHHPPYTCGGHSGNTDVITRWVPLFRQYGVDLVLSGHDHNYQRFVPSHGVVYVVHGGGGQVLYPLRSCPSGYPTRAFAREGHGFLDISVTTTAIKLHSVNLAGRVIDRYTIYP